MNWKLIALWSLVLFAATQVLSMIVGASAVHWTIYGDTMEVAFENARWARRIVLAVAAYVLYVFFLRRVSRLWFANLLGVFVAVEVLNASFEVLMGASMAHVVWWPFTLAHFMICMAALVTSVLLFRSDKTMQPTCDDARG